MALTYKRKFGLDWPSDMHDVYIDLLIAKCWRDSPYKFGNLDDPWVHMLRAASALFTPDELCISPWTEMHFMDFTTQKFCITWGAASCSKSNDYGCCAVLDVLPHFAETSTLLVSTTRKALLTRSYEAVQRYHHILKRNPYFLVPGVESRTTSAIILERDGEGGAVGNSKNGIFAMACDGSSGSSIVGIHSKYSRLILDEMSLLSDEAFKSRTNISIGSHDFRLFGLCNPFSYTDLAARNSVPKNGWESIDEFTESWETNTGCFVRHHNGFRSPAILEPGGAEKYKHLINQTQIDRILLEEGGNDQAPIVFTMVRGMPSPQGVERTVLTELEMETFGAKEKAVWAAGSTPVKIAGFDPAFTSGGDAAMLQFAEVGRVAPGVPAIVFGEAIRLTISAGSRIPVTAQLISQLRELLSINGVPVGLLGVDDSGTQSLSDALEMALGAPPVRFNFAAKAPDYLTVGGREKYSDRYSDICTALHVMFAEFVRARQVRGVSDDASRFITTRRYVTRKSAVKTSLESKAVYKTRTGGRSPDISDACVMAIGVARQVLGFSPGQSPSQFTLPINSPIQPTNFPRRLQLKTSYGARSNLKGYT